MSTSVPTRRNGFTPPYSKAQISAWVAMAVSIMQFPLVVSPIMPLQASIPVTLVFFATVVGTIYYGILALAADPMDVHLEQHLQTSSEPNDARDKETPWRTKLYNACNNNTTTELLVVPDEPMKQCWICDIQVAEHSMHCKFCNKCVYHFDHHCMWLNTCIGKANYSFFFRTMLFIFSMEFCHFCTQLGLLIDLFLGGPTKDRANDWFNAGANEAVSAIMIFFVCFNVVSLLLIGQLLWFHVGLQRENLTTYKYIVRDHQRKRDQSRIDAEIMQQRMTEAAVARREGNNLLAKRLEMGDRFRRMGCIACDPLNVVNARATDPDPEAGFAVSLGAARSQEVHIPSHEIDAAEVPSENGNGNGNGNGVAFISIKDVPVQENGVHADKVVPKGTEQAEIMFETKDSSDAESIEEVVEKSVEEAVKVKEPVVVEPAIADVDVETEEPKVEAPIEVETEAPTDEPEETEASDYAVSKPKKSKKSKKSKSKKSKKSKSKSS